MKFVFLRAENTVGKYENVFKSLYSQVCQKMCEKGINACVNLGSRVGFPFHQAGNKKNVYRGTCDELTPCHTKSLSPIAQSVALQT